MEWGTRDESVCADLQFYSVHKKVAVTNVAEREDGRAQWRNRPSIHRRTEMPLGVCRAASDVGGVTRGDGVVN